MTNPGSDPFPDFDDFSWRSFIALNWPAMAGAANRGKPDLTKAFSDTTAPRVWLTWKSRFEIFQPGGVAPAGWTSYDGANPCGAGFSNDVHTLSAFSAFGDFNQALFDMERLGNPLIAQNRTYTRYEVRVNEREFDSIVAGKWYVEANLPDESNAVPFSLGSIEVKAAWKILTDADTPEQRARYYVVPDAQVYDVAAKACRPHDIALVGFHIVTKTESRPQWIWSSFEHVDNVLGISTEPGAPAGTPLSYNDPAAPQVLGSRPPEISSTNKPIVDPAPMQVIRKFPVEPSTMVTNAAYWALPGIKDTVWRNYMLVMTQWPTSPIPETVTNTGDPFPTSGTNLANTTMETFFQKVGFSCMECHQLANDAGRDFVMFVTIDAFRENALAPADPFALRGIEQAKARSSEATEALLRSLTEFFHQADIAE